MHTTHHWQAGDKCTKGHRGEYRLTNPVEAAAQQSHRQRRRRRRLAVAVRGISQQIVCAFCRRALGSADEFRSRRERVKVNQKISIQ